MNIKKKLKDITPLRHAVIRIKSAKDFKYDRRHYILHSRDNRETKEQLCYNALLLAHALEKGMSFEHLRPFGKEKIQDISESIEKLEKIGNFESESAFVITINTLREYANIYEQHQWNDKPEYLKVKKILNKYSKIGKINAGVKTLSKDEIMENSIDYEKFLSGRHSIRRFASKRLSEKDIIKAVKIAKLTPSACNRQMIKVYSAKTKEADDAIKTTIRGNLSGFDIDSAHSLVVTFDTSAWRGAYERNQGYLNAGLFTMNLINAMHSLGIGSCLCEFQQPIKKEILLKKTLNIPECERVAVCIMAGYYLDENKVYMSPRIATEEIYREV